MRTLFFSILCFFLCLLPGIAIDSSADPQPSRIVKEPSASEHAHPAHTVKQQENQTKEEKIPESPELSLELSQSLLSIHTELVEKYKLAAPWRQKWEESRKQIEIIKNKADKLNAEFEAKKDLLLAVPTHEKNFSELIPALNRYRRWATYSEAIRCRLGLIKKDLGDELEPLYTIQQELKKLLDPINSLSDFFETFESDNQDLMLYRRDVNALKKHLEGMAAEQEADLKPAGILFERISKTQDQITETLPERWKSYYLQKPIPWLDAKVWSYLPHQIRIVFSGFEMRRALELPSDTNGWRKTLLRALISAVLFALALTILQRQSWVPTDTNPHVRHIFKVSLPIICTGLCLLLSSFSPQGDSFRFFIALGNLFIIFGQMHLAWDLRVLSVKDVPQQAAPLLRLFPLTCVAYVLLYMPLLPVVLLMVWMLSIIAVLIWRRYWPELNTGPLRLEKSIRTFDGIVLWLCLLLTICGLPICSVIIYLCSVSLLLASELCIGGLDQFNYLNENQPKEGVRAIISNIFVSLTAPIIIFITVSSVLLWVATLPGGLILMQEYLFKNISVGSAEFNFFHILIIISAFFLTKAIAVSGTRYLAQIIMSRKNNVDTTLITPAQTAFTYLTWIFFGLFVMRILDIDLKNAAMVMTGLSVGIGMGLQSIVNNFFSGLLLIFGRMLQVGDIIEVGGITGKVARISVRDTLVQTFDNAYIYVPNAEFISGHLINWSRNDSTVRANVSVGVAYGTDTELVIRTLKEIATKQVDILRYPEPVVVFKNFGDSTLDFCIYFWVNRYSDQIRICTDMRLAIEKAFAKRHIEIAFPQLDLHLAKPLPPRKKTTMKRTRVRTFAAQQKKIAARSDANNNKTLTTN